jgi:hypothetical protein
LSPYGEPEFDPLVEEAQVSRLAGARTSTTVTGGMNR